MAKSIEKAMLKALDQKPKLKKETDQKYRVRLMKAGNKLSEEEFYALPENLQVWLNDAVNADNDGDNIRDLTVPALHKGPKALVKKHWEKIDCKVLKEHPDLISEYVKRQNGIYVLYSGDKLHYVGLAKSLLGRLLQHLVDRQKGKWDRFSVYLTGPEHRKDLETLLIRIARPPGCVQRGNFVDSTNLTWELKEKIKKLFEDFRN
jgi:hypothetical protein